MLPGCERAQGPFQTSLQFLDTDHINLSLFHNVSERRHLDDILEFPFNYLEDRALPELLPLARETGAGFIAMKPLAGGALASGRAAIRWLIFSAGRRGHPRHGGRVRSRAGSPCGLGPRSEPGGYRRHRTRPQGADRQVLQALGYCLPCPQGIPVNTLISAELFLKRAGWSRADAKYLQMLEDAAANCQQCGECELRCPYNLPPASMVRPTALRAAEKVRAEIARRVQPG